VQLRSGLRLDPGGSDDVEAALTALRADIDEASSSIELETIWELITAEGGEALHLGEMARLWFGEAGPANFFAMDEALRSDAVYFKERRDGIRPRGAREVESERARLEGIRKRTDARNGFLDALAAMLSASEPDDGALQSLRRDPSQRKYLDVVHDFAASGEAFERRPEATSLLGDLSRRHVGPFSGSPEGAFQLLRKLGLVEKHENLSLRRNGIRTTFGAALLEGARVLANQPFEPEQGLVDLTDLEIFTIDDPTTRDIDDGLHVTFGSDRSLEVGIHITDVCGLIEPNGPVDLEARRRGASVYLPTGVVSMFPEVLSEGSLSLVVTEQRQALSFIIEVDGDGQMGARRIVPSLIRVKHRLDYDEADLALQNPGHSLHAPLVALESLADRYRDSRIDAGAIYIGLPEVKVRAEGETVEVNIVESSASRGLVAEMMVLAGEVAADFCVRERIPVVYRTQSSIEDPDEASRLESLEPSLARDLERIRFMRRGELGSEPGEHAGLGLSAYVHATSPIRRYADVVVHYQLRSFLLGRPPVFEASDIVVLAAQVQQTIQAVITTQRESARYWLLEYLRQRVDRVWEGQVMFHDSASNRRRVPVVLTDTLLRANVSAKHLKPGQRIQVRVSQADPRRDLLRLELA
jgi:exoribonuclease-2